MTAYSERSFARAIAIALLATVATQIFYISVVSGSDSADTLRPIVWMTELVAFSIIAASAIVLAGRSHFGAFAFAAIALGGITNVIQVGMGLAEFGPAREAGDEAVFGTVLAGAFFLYFHGKAMFGAAAILLGAAAASSGAGATRIIGALAALAGLAAVALNLVAMGSGMDIMFAAGGAGTAAAALLGLLLLIMRPKESDATVG